MRVLFVTSEVASLFKLGGLGDVGYALPVALKAIGVDIVIALPYYNSIHLKHTKCLGGLAVTHGDKRELVFIFRTQLPGTDVEILLFRHPYIGEYKASGDTELAHRFAFFSHIVATYLQASSFSGDHYDVIHCNDWHTGLVPFLVGESNKLIRKQRGHRVGESIQSKSIHSVMTVHNPIYQGVLPASAVKSLGIDMRHFFPFLRKWKIHVNLLREGLEHADVITTVSPTFAKELIESDYGPQVSDILQKRQDQVVGILNGLDSGIWNPKTDPALPATYDVATVQEGKQTVKAYLQQSLRLPVAEVPLFGFVGRLDPNQKGLDIMVSALTQLLPLGTFQVVILGTGSPKEVRMLESLMKRYPYYMCFIHTFDERLARRIYAGADFMLVPSRFEPCGLTQMIAMRYGTIPLVRKTGGLADSVKDGKTGFVFEEYSGAAMAQKMQEAIRFWTQQVTSRHQMAKRVMRQDFSWKKSARAYARLYKQVMSVTKTTN